MTKLIVIKQPGDTVGTRNRDGGVEPLPPQSIVSFSASPTTVASGAAVVLTWQTANATSVMLNGVAVAASGSQTVNPTQTTNYTLVANGSLPSPVIRQVQVTVQETAPPPVTAVFVNGGFELPVVSGYKYFTTLEDGWQHSGSALCQNNSAFNAGQPAPQGAQVCALQHTNKVEQTINLPAGSYQVAFKAAQRDLYQWGTQVVQVRVDGNVVGSYQPPDKTFTEYQTPPFTVVAGDHVFSFIGAGWGSDFTALIDDVHFVGSTGGDPVIEPPPPPPPPPPPGDSPLSTLVNGMASDSWALVTPEPINMAAVIRDPTNPGSGSQNIVPFASNTPYDPIRKRVLIAGATHSSTAPKFVQYDLATNTFSEIANPDFASHPFQHLTIDPVTGTPYKIFFGGYGHVPGLYRWDDTVWTQLPCNVSTFVSINAVYGALVWFAGKPVFCEGISGGVWDLSGAAPVQIGQHPTSANVYQNVAVVTPQGLVFGGGNGSAGTWREDHGKELYLLTAPNGTCSRMGDAPYPVGVSNGMQMCGDGGGKVLLMGGRTTPETGKRETWSLDPVSGLVTRKANFVSTGPQVGWDDQFNPTSVFDAANFQNFPNDVICSEIAPLGCVVTVQYREGHGPARMYVYKR